MQFESFSEFIAMGGHGLYVWLAYGIGLVIIGANLVVPLCQRGTLLKRLRSRLRREKNRL